MRGTRLIANLGAEEGDAALVETGNGPAAEAAALWRLLFAGDARGPEWPADLGPPPDEAVFAWLADPGEAVAWLVTEDAVRHATDEGRRLSGPSPEVVARVHDKAFAIEAARSEGLEPDSLAGVATVLGPDDLAEAGAARERIAAALAGWPGWLRAEGQGAVLKPRLGTSGRGRTPFRDPSTIEAGVFPRLAARGGAILEPWLERERDHSVQLHLGEDGVLLLGTLEQCVTPAGVPRGLRGTLDRRGRVTSGSADDEALREAAVAIALRARDAGYRGPCGVDAFRFRGPGGSELRPVVELNARFTLGTVAVGLARRVRERAARHFHLDANERLHFHLDLGREPGRAPGRNAPRAEPPPAADRVLDFVLTERAEPGPGVRLRIARSAEDLGAG